MFRFIETPPLEETEARWTPVYKDAPLAPVRLVDVKRYPAWRVIRCPYCEDTHDHGAGGVNADHFQYLGGRMAHCHPEIAVSWEVQDASPCWNGSAEYRLIPIEGNPSKAELDEHFPTVLDTELDGYHISKWTEPQGLDSRYQAYMEKARKSAPAYVYLIEAAGRIKIGVASDPERRLKEIQTSSPFHPELVYAGVVDSPYKVEKALHSFFAPENVHHEWFDLSSDQIQSAIARIKKVELS